MWPAEHDEEAVGLTEDIDGAPRPRTCRIENGARPRCRQLATGGACILGACLIAQALLARRRGPHGDPAAAVPGAAVGLAEENLLEEATQELVNYYQVKQPKFFPDPGHWHKSSMTKKDVVERLREPSYAGPEGLWCVGINFVGFSLEADKGRHGFIGRPTLNQMQYFHEMGVNCFRLSITWERLQTRLGSEELDLVPGIEETVDLVTKKWGAHAILVPHNRDHGLMYDGMNAMRSDFVSLWTAMAKKWQDNPKVIFNLYSEPLNGYEAGKERFFDPHAEDEDGDAVEFWRQWAQAAIDAIRKSGATNLILVPGLHQAMAAEWDGAWGEALDGSHHAGNTRLAALDDSAKNLAFDVHQFMDEKFLGEAGCEGHKMDLKCKGKPGCRGVDEGLSQLIAWAKRYKKRLMLTEVASVPAGGDSDKLCKKRMHDYLQRVRTSGVFLGYQVWQAGCSDCPGDLWSKAPLNSDWYRINEFGEGCSLFGSDCRGTRCCKEAGQQCFQKNEAWAGCKPACIPGIDPDEKKEFQTNWTCVEIQHSIPPAKCSDDAHDCRATGCCNDIGMKCYTKDEGWAMCRTSCNPGAIWERDAPEHQTPWSCAVIEGPPPPTVAPVAGQYR